MNNIQKYFVTGLILVWHKAWFTIGADTLDIYEFKDINDTYTGSCEPLRYKCAGLHSFPSNCSQYLVCDQMHILKRPCPVGTQFDRKTGKCGHPFGSDCTCPNQQNRDPGETGQNDSDSDSQTVGIAIGIVCVVVIIIIVVLVTLCLYKRRKEKAKENKEKSAWEDPCYQIYSTINDDNQGITKKNSQNSSGSYVYPDQMPDGIAPAVPNARYTDDPVYDNSVVRPNSRPNEPDEQTFTSINTVADEDGSKRTTCVTGLENDLYAQQIEQDFP